jgi:regulator of sigma E protease
MTILIAILAVIFVLGVAINIHEFGHFIVAKMFGMRVEAYSFFGLGKMIWYKKIGNTKYGISPIPLGAYVKLYGDEATGALEGGESNGEKVPDSELYELRPRWQKFFVMLGGPFMNFVLAIAIPFTIAMMYGVQTTPAPIVGVVIAGGAAEKAGIKVGDRVVNFEGVENPSWESIRDDALLIPDKEVNIAVERGGQVIPLKITPTKVTENGQSAGMIDFVPDAGTEPVVVGEIQPDMPAASSELQKGDWIVSVNGKAVRNTQEMRSLITEIKDQPIKLTVNRNNQRKEVETRAVEKEGQWYIGIKFDSSLLTAARQPVGVVGAFNDAIAQNMRILRLTGKAFSQVGTGERSARDTVSGPIGIVRTISDVAQTAGFQGLVFLLMVISLNLGVMNLLPIPMLDGGQIMLLGVEKVFSWFGKTLSMAIKEKINLAGLAFVLLLMLFTTFNDVSRFFR